jgi:hypothetical protein
MDRSRTSRKILKGKIYEVKPQRTLKGRYTHDFTRDCRKLLRTARRKILALHTNIWGNKY